MPRVEAMTHALVAANDASYADAATMGGEGTIAARQGEDNPSSTDHGWPHSAASPTIEEVRYADELRLRIRQRYLARVAPPVAPWCVGVD